MNRSITNRIRWAMDELVPAFIRDSRVFMWPFFCVAYRTLRPRRYMSFKSNVFKMSPLEYETFYNQLNSVSRKRSTDNSNRCVAQIIEGCLGAKSILDVGCGHGYVLRKLRDAYPRTRLAGVDLLKGEANPPYEYFNSVADKLPFRDGEFDVVCCTHMIEHATRPESVVGELVRVAREKVIIVTPKQRPYYYTLDEHINFYFYEAQLEKLAPSSEMTIHISNLSGDWYMVIQK